MCVLEFGSSDTLLLQRNLLFFLEDSPNPEDLSIAAGGPLPCVGWTELSSGLGPWGGVSSGSVCQVSFGVINEALLGPAAHEWLRMVLHKHICLSCSCLWALMEARAVFTNLADLTCYLLGCTATRDCYL